MLFLVLFCNCLMLCTSPDHGAQISECPPSVSRQQIVFNNNSSYTTGPVLTKLQRNVPWITIYKMAKTNFIHQKPWPPRDVAYHGI